MKSSIQLSPTKHLDNISKMFRKLYNDEQLTDCTLYCKDGYIKAHKLVLATSSPYFHRIFTETYGNSGDNINIYQQNQHTALIMHGISYQNLHNLIELIYKGHVDVVAESVNPLYELAGEFQLTGITGILRSTDDANNNDIDDNSKQTDNTHDKGQKRAIDNDTTPDTVKLLKNSNDSGGGTKKQSAWAKKQRKFKCDLCPSSFKRSSHLTRHQLVHTGERPYACDRCDKAFSRHDKLKHHVRKTHSDITTSPTIDKSEQEPVVIDTITDHNEEVYDLQASSSTATTTSPTTALSLVNLQKRPRGRPRKYPISSLIEQQLIKRGRGRPRINSINPPQQQQQQQQMGENYDITNLPYGDLEYLTMPLNGNGNGNDEQSVEVNDHESVIIEPYIEIKTECDSKENIEGMMDVEESKRNELI